MAVINNKKKPVKNKRKIDNSRHCELVKISAKWLKKYGCSVIMSELRTLGANEIPDAIGWRETVSILIECKTSREDYLTDLDKSFRKNPESGMGNHRFYLCPEGVIKPEELPENWGLLYVIGKRVKIIKGNDKNTQWYLKPFKSNIEAEKSLLLSFLRKNKNQETECQT